MLIIFYAPPELWSGFLLLKYNCAITFEFRFGIFLMPNLIIGSRGSKLALWQSNWVKDRLEEVYEGVVVSIEVIKTTGDKLTEAALAEIGGKGVFTKEIEEALLDLRVDLAVHSLK